MEKQFDDTEKKRRNFYEYLHNEEYSAAVTALFSIIDDDPAPNNYSFVSSRLKELDLPALGFHHAKIAILSSFTIEPIIPYLYVKCCRAKLNSEFYVGGYNLFRQEILDPESQLYKFNPEVLVLAIRLQELDPQFYNSFLDFSGDQVKNEIDDIAEQIRALILEFRETSNAVVIIHNFETPPRPILGIIDNRQNPSQKNSVLEINAAIENIASQIPGVYVLDYDNLTALHGKLLWQDDKMQLLAGIPISGNNYIHLADEYIRFLKPLKNLNRKCLVLDLDNTLWGGIVGEDGINGIKLGNTYPGNAFLNFQREILDLYNKGIILAINSRNNEADAMAVLKEHPDMILREKHFASKRINWQDKVRNMEEIAEELNIGLDSIAFIDDSPVERERMKMGLPEVLTIDMPSDPVKYVSVLRELTDFEILSFSSEDRQRGEMYLAQVGRKRLQKSSASLEDFYRSLDMTITIYLAKPKDHAIPRISQLTQRTNQFNLTTKRYSESDISHLIESEDYHVFYARLRDKFGDNGIIGVCIIKENSKFEWEIDTYLLSCRVLGRTVETAFLSFIVNVASRESVKSIHGIYVPTKKNQPASDLYKLHGFKLHEQSLKKMKWVLDVSDSDIAFPEWIKLETNYG